MINQTTVSNLISIIRSLKSSDQYKYLSNYFEEKRKEVVEDAIKESGNLTQATMIEYNARMQIYEELINFDILLDNEIK
jgi:predicted DNA-binding protein YlxM (UPF0122 family)